MHKRKSASVSWYGFPKWLMGTLQPQRSKADDLWMSALKWHVQDADTGAGNAGEQETTRGYVAKTKTAE